LISAVD
jgi:hypothetical protein